MMTSSLTISRIRPANRRTRDGRGWPTCRRCGGRLFPAAVVPVCVACPIPFHLADRTAEKGRARRRSEGGGR